MRILMLAPGKSIHSKRSLNWLLEGGCHVTFVDYTDPRPQGANRHAYRFMPYLGMRGRRLYRPLLGSRLADRLGLWLGTSWLRLMKRYLKPDVVHVLWVDHRAYCCLKAGLRPLVLTAWGTDINKHFLPAADQRARQMIAQTVAGADMVIGHASEIVAKCALLAESQVRTSRRPFRGETLTFGVDTGVFHPGYGDAAIALRHRLGIPVEAAVLLSTRGLSPTYGHHLILDAFAQARLRLKTNSILMFTTFAANKTYEAKLRRRAEELGISGVVRWVESIPFDQMPALYALADLIVNYPTMDAFPVTFLEAAACERPVITCLLPSYQGTFAEKYAYTVEPENTAALAEAIVKVAHQKPADRAERLSEARRVVVQEYDESVCARRLLDIYQAVLDEAKRLKANGDRF